MSRILVVETDPRVAAFLAGALEADGHVVTSAGGTADGEAWAAAHPFDLVVLDLGGRSGETSDPVTRLRRTTDAGIVTLGDDSPGTAVDVLDAGAVDHLGHPFDLGELLARVRARLRATDDEAGGWLESGPVRLDVLGRRAWTGTAEVDLSAREFALAETLVRHRGQALGRDQLLSLVWGTAHLPGSNVVDVHVRNLRRKLGRAFVTTVRGVGYRAGT